MQQDISEHREISSFARYAEQHAQSKISMMARY